MSEGLAELTKAALTLSLEDRFALVESVIESTVEEEVAEVASAWDTEIRRRLRAVEEGSVVGIPWEEIKRELAERRRT